MTDLHDTGTGPTEAGADEVSDVAGSFAQGVLADGVSNECYSEHKGAYVHLFMGGYPADGFTDDYALARAAEIGEEVASMGWFVAKAEIVIGDDSPSRGLAIEDGDADEDEEPQTMLFVDLFPRLGEMSDAAGHERFFWHASPTSNRASILADGLLPRACGNDFIVLPEDRIYACTHAMFLENVELDMARSRSWRDLDLWRIDLAAIPDHEWRDDVEMEGMSAWTHEAIPAEALMRCGRLQHMHSGGWRCLEGHAETRAAA
jgi:hypothetical protein